MRCKDLKISIFTSKIGFEFIKKKKTDIYLIVFTCLPDNINLTQKRILKKVCHKNIVDILGRNKDTHMEKASPAPSIGHSSSTGSLSHQCHHPLHTTKIK